MVIFLLLPIGFAYKEWENLKLLYFGESYSFFLCFNSCHSNMDINKSSKI